MTDDWDYDFDYLSRACVPARKQRIDGPGRWQSPGLTKNAHPRPEHLAFAQCHVSCRCRYRKKINRRLCEDKYQAAIQSIIEDINRRDQ